MIKIIRNKVKAEHKVVISNAFSLFLLQGTNYILPLILFPYLVRVLGIENFGLLAFATATVAFFRGVVAYGFDLSGTQQIAVNRKSQEKINEIFSSILVVKAILVVVSFIMLILLIMVVEKIHLQREVFLYSFLIVIGDAIFPTWFFQGMEKMKLITYIRIAYKTSFVLIVVLFVKNSDDYILVPLIDGIGAIAAGILALILVKRDFNVSCKLPKFYEVIFQFKNSWYIFVSQMAVHFYTSINIFVLGLLVNNQAVGYYALAEKIYGAIRGILDPVNQALFPFLSKKFTQNKLIYYNIVKKITIGYFIILIGLSILTFVFSQNIVELISGKNINKSIDLVKIFSITILFAIGGFYSSLLIVKFRSKDLLTITVLTMLLNLTLLYPSIYWYGIYGLAYQFLIVQLFQAYLQIKYNYEIWRG